MRKLAREVAFVAIYESLFNNNENSFSAICEDLALTNEEDVLFAKKLFTLWNDNRSDIKFSISTNLQDYEYDRVYKIDIALISLALTEIKYYKETPQNIVINEVVNLAKKYSTEKSYAFVNGVIKKLLEV